MPVVAPLDVVGLFIGAFLDGADDFAVTIGADTIHIPVIDAGKVAKPKMPYLSVRDITAAPSSPPRYFGQRLAPTAKTDVLAAVSGQTTYQVSQRDIDSVTSIAGTVGGAPHTFAPSEFEVVSTAGYTTADAIRFTGTLPDPATSFTVVYRHRLYDTLVGTQFDPTLRLFLHVADLRAGDQPTVASNYLRERLAAMLWQALWGRLVELQGRALDAIDAKEGASLVVNEPFLLGAIPADRSDTYLRVTADVRLAYHLKAAIDRHEAIGKVPATGSPSV